MLRRTFLTGLTALTAGCSTLGAFNAVAGRDEGARRGGAAYPAQRRLRR